MLPNIGKLWTKDEEKLLLERLKQRLCFEEISQLHGRTHTGIKRRIMHIVWELLNDKTNYYENLKKLNDVDHYYVKIAIDYTRPKLLSYEDSNTHLKIEIEDLKNMVRQLRKEIEELKLDNSDYVFA